MINCKDRNTVYFSDLIRTDPVFKLSFERIKPILDKHHIVPKFLEETKAIWCQDYMPIQIDREKYVQFVYDPNYLIGYESQKSDPNSIIKKHNFKTCPSELILDGGNVIYFNGKAIVTNRVFKENPSIPKEKLIGLLERDLEAQVYFIPDITNDMTGHIDGYMRFIDEKTVLVNKLENEYKYWQNGVLKMLKEANLDFVEIPWFIHDDKDNQENALGCYLNYLELGNLIIAPIFETPVNYDNEAICILKSIFADRIIETVNINEVANEGGLMNCITWTVLE